MTLLLVSLVGIALFGWPFLGLGLPPQTVALTLSLGALAGLVVVELGMRRLDARRLTLLAAMAAIEAALRLALVNGIGGFSPIFFLILVAGYSLGPSFGFLLGAFGLLVSGIATGGVGPWLPYQMFGAAWMGMAAGIVGSFMQSRTPGKRDLVALVAVAIVTGFAYGALTDTWEWVAYYVGPAGLSWSPDLSPLQALGHFALYYTATSLVWDCFRAFGDALAILAFGTPVLLALRRLRARFAFEVVARPPTPRVDVAPRPGVAPRVG